MKKNLMTAIFWMMLLGPNLLFSFMPSRADGVNPEKRELASFPEFTKEGYEAYPMALQNYVNDHAAFRSSFLSANAILNLKLFGHADSREVLAGRDGWFYFIGGEALKDFLGTNRFSQESLAYINDCVQKTADYYRSRGTEFVVLLAPNKEAVYPEYLPAGYEQVSEITKSEELIAYLRANSDVTILDPRDYFRQNKEYLWYYKTDTHWNDAAGFVASQMIIEAAGGTPVSIDDVTISYHNFQEGDLTKLFHLPQSMSHDVSASVSGYLEDTVITMTDINGNGSIVYEETSRAPDNRHIAFFRDSFGTALTATLPKYFKNVDFYHWQVFEPAFLEERKPDILVYEIGEREQGRIPEDMMKLAPGAFPHN